MVSFRRSWEGSQGSVVRGTVCGEKMYLALEMRAHPVMRCVSTMMSAEPLKSSGRIGQAMWWRSFSRIGSLGG